MQRTRLARPAGFESPEGLRALLIRLHEAGAGAWQRDRDAAELMRYTADRYRRLARKYELDAWEVASAAFEVMLAPSTRKAGNPWAVVTRAVQITCGVEMRAAGMLVSPGKVRHAARIAGFHDAIRFAEQEHLADYHPAFAIHPATDDDDDPDDEDRLRVAAALTDTVGLFVTAGWDAALVADCVEHVASRLADLSSRSRAVEVLRRDHTVPVLGCHHAHGPDCCGSCWGIPPRNTLAPRPATASCCACSAANLPTRYAATVLWQMRSAPPIPTSTPRRGRGGAPDRMTTPAAAASTVATPPTPPAGSTTLGARLAAASRQTQGLASTVDDPTVLTELRRLCAAPRPTKQTASRTREGPAPFDRLNNVPGHHI